MRSLNSNNLQEIGGMGHPSSVLYIEVLVGYAMVPIELLLERCMTAKKNVSNAEMLKGTLDMMILRTLLTGDAHGHTIAKVIERTSEDVLEVEQGSLYPALHRLADRGWVSSYWGTSENNRKARFYKLTAAGRRQLVQETNRWRQMARAIGLVMGEKRIVEEGEQ
jgi:PadR family transcriptional regulator PadR